MERRLAERDYDIIEESAELDRLRGITQVFPGPGAHANRYDHCRDVSEIAGRIAGELGLNVARAQAIGLAHDCGHTPFGHAGEKKLQHYLPSFDHASWAADVVLRPLNLTAEVLDGIKGHAWSQPTPRTAEGDIVRWADRIAYLTRDFFDALHLDLVSASDQDAWVADFAGSNMGAQRQAFIDAVVTASRRHRYICMLEPAAVALARYRCSNLYKIYDHSQLRAVGSFLEYEFNLAFDALIGVARGSSNPITQAAEWAIRHTDKKFLELASLSASRPNTPSARDTCPTNDLGSPRKGTTTWWIDKSVTQTPQSRVYSLQA